MYYETGELYHYGVLGMKWGKRKVQRADRTIRNIENQRKINEINYKHKVNEAKIKRSESSDRFGRIKDAALRNKLNQYAKEHKNSEILNKYEIAKAKAKKDPKYKDSSEYKSQVKEGRKLMGQIYVATVAASLVVGALQVTSQNA